MTIQAPENSGIQAYIRSPLAVRGSGAEGYIWASRDLLSTATIHRLLKSDFSVELPTNSFSGGEGIGGDQVNIWACTNNKIHEISTVDLSSIRNSNSPGTDGVGCGGGANSIWHSDLTAVNNYELSTTDFSTIQTVSCPGSDPEDIGGDADTVYHTDRPPLATTGTIYELADGDLSTVRSDSSPPKDNPYGIGGDADTIWYTGRDDFGSSGNIIAELSTADFSVLRSDSSNFYTSVGSD